VPHYVAVFIHPFVDLSYRHSIIIWTSAAAALIGSMMAIKFLFVCFLGGAPPPFRA
jgi:hypothetical protein